jgi:hypothetical protein
VPQSVFGAEIARFAAEAHGTYPSERPPDSLLFGRLRVFCSRDVDQIVEHGATFSIVHALSFSRGEPFTLERAEFDQRMQRLQDYTSNARKHGITSVSYVSQNASTARQGDPSGWVMSDVWKDDEWWNRYSDLYGPRPAEEPSEWLQLGADGVYGGHVWIPPEATQQRHYEVRGCPHSPGFRHFMAGVINVLLEAGLDGIYLDHSELTEAHSKDSIRCFREFLAVRYAADELKTRFDIADVSQAVPAAKGEDPLWAETVLFQAASEAEFHRYLRDHARQRNPDFIITGNLWGGFGFQSAALSGSDIQLAGMVDTFLYSELATGTESPERGQANTPGTRGGVRTSMSPMIRVLAASSRTHAATSYTYYPQTPNPIPTEGALFNIQRLAMAEAFANHTAFRRVESHHAEPVLRASKSVYDLLRGIEGDLLGAEMASDVAIIASLQGCYYGHYSYHREVSRALTDAGIIHEMIAPRSLYAEKLQQYRAVIVPNSGALSEDAYGALLEYAEQGSAVIGFGAVGAVDLLGGAGPGETHGLSPFEMIALAPDRLAADNAAVGYDRSGSQHAAWARGQWPEPLKQTMGGIVDAVERAVGDRLSARLHGPAGIEATLMRCPGSLDQILHLVNYGVDLDGKMSPAENVRLSVATGGQGSVVVEWQALDGVRESLPVRRVGARWEFTVPRLDIYGIALVKPSGS